MGWTGVVRRLEVGDTVRRAELIDVKSGLGWDEEGIWADRGRGEEMKACRQA
jgi:hypothetical protein